uniref:Uncharacterized protein n=1 Tax=Heliothis virescens TaxID=7102 RepID=A0A2A4K6Y9_HELVI
MYFNRHALNSVKPPVVAPIAEGRLPRKPKDGPGALKPKCGSRSNAQTIEFTCPPLIGPVWWFDSHSYYKEVCVTPCGTQASSASPPPPASPCPSPCDVDTPPPPSKPPPPAKKPCPVPSAKSDPCAPEKPPCQLSPCPPPQDPDKPPPPPPPPQICDPCKPPRSGGRRKRRK